MKISVKYFYLSFAIVITSAIILSSCSQDPDGWKFPDMSKVPPGALGDSIKHGWELIVKTPLFIGPEVKDITKRFAGNNLACSNCHIDGGTRPNSLGFVGVYLVYPEYSAIVDSTIMIQQRINECMRRSMYGKPLPIDSYEMRCLVLYYKWISSEVITQIAKEYLGLPKLGYLPRAADTSKGRNVYADKCMSCHGYNGTGSYVNDTTKNGFSIPAVWGSDSYDNGAGMYRLITSAAFIKSKMPFLNAELTDDEAWDVAAYINSMPRRDMEGLSKDFPDLNKKPIDCPYPPYADSIPQIRHKYGPYGGLK
ncbi:MAG: c-type cytochrome [Ignavibacteria bacterium]